MRYLIRNNKKQYLLLLSAVYLLAHGFLLIATGRWWDDWCSVDQSIQVSINSAMQMGRPSAIIVSMLCKSLPEPGYRIIAFIMYYWCDLYLYRILKEWLSISDNKCFAVCALYAVIPVNDARILLAVFPYTISLFFYMAGMCYLSIALNKSVFQWSDRAICYVLFIVSFTTSSILVFYALALLMIFTKVFPNKRKLTGFIDFLFLPIIFWVAKNRLFPVYGAYQNYNSVTFSKVLSGLRRIFIADVWMIRAIVRNFAAIGNKWITIILLLMFLHFLISRRKSIISIIHAFVEDILALCDNKGGVDKETAYQSYTDERFDKESMILLIVGVVALSVGLFAYVVIRSTYQICTVAENGRDSLLVAFGAAMIIYSLITLFIKKCFQPYIVGGLVLCGIAFFIQYYVSWQTDYYRQLGFQYQLLKHDELVAVHNIIYRNNDSGPINIRSFYALNGNSEMALGVDDKLIMVDFPGTSILQHESLDYFVESGNYHMDTYDTNYKTIDAIVDYSLDADFMETIRLKTLEVFMPAEFKKRLFDDTIMTVYLNGTDIFQEILDENGYKNSGN